jgi:hypothetical protein
MAIPWHRAIKRQTEVHSIFRWVRPVGISVMEAIASVSQWVEQAVLDLPSNELARGIVFLKR